LYALLPNAVSHNSTTNAERPRVFESPGLMAHAMGYLPPQQTVPLNSLYRMPAVSSLCLGNGIASAIAPPQSEWAVWAAGRAQELAHVKRINANDTNQEELERRIRREELALLLDKITTQRLSTFLRQAFNP
jgi:hypothetical protein